MKTDEKARAALLIAWYTQNRRSLPWRDEPTPYRVWVSEVMLQQTRIEAVLPYFDRFMRALPDVKALAEAPQETLYKLWEGLGYYSRVRHLNQAAQLICREYGGQLPDTFDTLLALPGIGDYTAAAIASIAFGQSVPTVDGNVLRVVARLTNDDRDVLLPATRRAVRDLLGGWIPADNPGGFNQAMMELGERVCLPNTVPRCGDCPLAGCCEAHRLGNEAALPVRSPKKPRRVEQRTVLLLVTAEVPPRVILHKRADKGLLAGLWEFPQTEGFLTETQAADMMAHYGIICGELRRLPDSRHLFTHIEWQMCAYTASVESARLPENCVAVTAEQLRRDYALPGAFAAYTRLFQ